MLLPCSRSARPQKGLARRPQWDQHGCRSTGRRYEQAWREHYYRNVLVRRAQWRISQATHEKEVRTGRKRAVKPSQSPFLEGVQYEQAAQTDYPAKPQRSDSQQAIQTGQPTRPQASHNRRRNSSHPPPRAPGSSSPEGYVEDCDEPRTKLGAFS